jgi:Ca-activated chloride channel homolog
MQTPHSKLAPISSATGMRFPASALLFFACLTLATLLSFAMNGPALGQDRSTSPVSPERTFTIAAHVEMVALDITVVDKHGTCVSGLTQDNFRIFEDGVPQQIKLFGREDVPVTIGLVVDNSGSMRPKRSYVITAAMAFAQASNPADELFVVHFNDDFTFGLPPGLDFTRDPSQLRGALMRLDCEGRTALYDAVAASLEHVKKGAYAKKALLIVSDGQDNVSTKDFDAILEMARQSGAAIYTIGAYDPESDRHNTKVLKKLAEVTGGQFYFPTSLPQIGSACQHIAKDIRSRYTLSYCSSNPRRDGAYRRVSVTATAPDRGKLSIKAREGYFAPLEKN